MRPPSPLLVWGRQYSRADQDWGVGVGGRQWQFKKKEKKDTVVLEPSGYLGTAPHCLPQGCPPGAQANRPVKKLPETESLGEGHLPTACTSHFPRKKPKKEIKTRPRDRGEKSQVFTQLTRSLYGKENI